MIKTFEGIPTEDHVIVLLGKDIWSPSVKIFFCDIVSNGISQRKIKEDELLKIDGAYYAHPSLKGKLLNTTI